MQAAVIGSRSGDDRHRPHDQDLVLFDHPEGCDHAGDRHEHEVARGRPGVDAGLAEQVGPHERDRLIGCRARSRSRRVAAARRPRRRTPSPLTILSAASAAARARRPSRARCRRGRRPRRSRDVRREARQGAPRRRPRGCPRPPYANRDRRIKWQRRARLERARRRTAAPRSPATRSTAAPRAAARRCSTTLGNVTSYTDTGLANGTTYYYKVTAVNGVGEGALLERALGDAGAATVPGAPTLNSATARQRRASRSPGARPASNGGSRDHRLQGLPRHHERRRDAARRPSATSPSYTDTRPSRTGRPTTTRSARVNSVGEGALSNERSATPPRRRPCPARRR